MEKEETSDFKSSSSSGTSSLPPRASSARRSDETQGRLKGSSAEETHVGQTINQDIDGSVTTLLGWGQTSYTQRYQVCVFITAGPITKLFAGGGGGEWRTDAMRDTNTSYTQLMREARS